MLGTFRSSLTRHHALRTCAARPDMHDLWMASNPLPQRAGIRQQQEHLQWSSHQSPEGTYSPESGPGVARSAVEQRGGGTCSTSSSGTSFHAKDAQGVLHAVRLLQDHLPRVRWEPDSHTWQAFDPSGRPAVLIKWPRTLPRGPASGPQDASSIGEHLAKLEQSHVQSQAAAQLVGGSGSHSSSSSGSSGGVPTGPVPRLDACLLVLLCHDSAVLGIYDRCGLLTHHKVLTGYTVRQKRGQAQDSHERTGGSRSTAGSAIRRRETQRLWQAAAERLHQWGAHIAGCDRLFASGDVRVWNLLYDESRSPAVPVSRHDPRWERVGVHVARPRLRDLARCYHALGQGQITCFNL